MLASCDTQEFRRYRRSKVKVTEDPVTSSKWRNPPILTNFFVLIEQNTVIPKMVLANCDIQNFGQK